MKDTRDEAQERDTAWQDYWAVAVRRRWYLMGPFFLCGLLGFAVAQVWPFLYRSEALILVEQQRVPEQYVTPNVITTLQHRLDSMTQQILSRTRLQRLIEDFGLYTRERSRMPMDDVIDQMRKSIAIELVQTPGRQGDLTGFRIKYSASSPQVAQRITNELTSLFIEENLRARTQQSVGTTSFLENQLEEARKELAQQEERVREYKLRYLGQLPEQQQGNLQILSSLETQLHSNTAASDRAEQQKIYLESMQTQFQEMMRSSLAQAKLMSRTAGTGPSPETITENLLEDLRRQLAALKARYTGEHPDILRLQALLKEWDTVKPRPEAKEAGAAGGEPGTATPAGPVKDRGLVEIESRLKALTLEIESQKREREELRKRIREYQTRLDLTPVREQELAEITRTSENARAHYQSLLQKKLQSELASNLEKRQQGEQFRILDPASLPEKPEGRLEVILLGWIVGVCGGIGLTFLREFTDSTVHTERDVNHCASLPVLVSIPVLRSPDQEAWRKWSRRLQMAAVMLLTLLSLGTGIHTYLTS